MTPTGSLGEFGSHLQLRARIAEGLTACADASVLAVAVHADQHEPVTHGRNDGVCLVPCCGDRPDRGDSSGPFQGLPAVGAKLPDPTAVVDLAEPRKHLVSGIAAHRQDGGHVFDEHTPGTQLGQTYNKLGDARAARAKIIAGRQAGMLVKPTKVTVAEAIEARLNGRNLRPSTVWNYRGSMQLVSDRLGHIQLQNLTKAHLDEMVTDLLADGRRVGNLKRQKPQRP